MGLDTVELVYSFERYFSLSIPDPVCEKLYTVADVAAYISEQLGVTGQRQSIARDLVRQQLSQVLRLPPDAFDAATMQQALPTAAAVAWLQQQLRKQYGLLAPELPFKPQRPPDGPSFFEKLLNITPRPPQVPWPAQPLTVLADWVIAANYEQLISRPPTNAYEVERAILGITSASSGVPIAEIELNSSFTNDLGMD